MRTGRSMTVLTAGLMAVTALFPSGSSAQEAEASPRTPGETWMRYATPEEAGWSSERIAEVKAFADSVGSAVGMLVHDGAVVTSWGDVTHLDGVASIAKALQVLVTGIYVERGDIALDATLDELGIEDDPPLRPCEKEARVRHLLAMKSGVYHRAPIQGYDWIDHFPERCSVEPGEQFVYQSWDVNALNAVFEQQTGKTFQNAFWRDIVRPLDFEDSGRATVVYAVSPVQSELRHVMAYMSARDLARVGLLMVRNGSWRGEQLVPADWLERMRSPQHRFSQGHAVGWMVWLLWQNDRLRELGAYLLSGAGLNIVMMVPERDVVFVHRADPLHGSVHGRQVHEQLLRLLDARVEEAEEKAKMVPFQPED